MRPASTPRLSAVRAMALVAAAAALAGCDRLPAFLGGTAPASTAAGSASGAPPAGDAAKGVGATPAGSAGGSGAGAAGTSAAAAGASGGDAGRGAGGGDAPKGDASARAEAPRGDGDKGGAAADARGGASGDSKGGAAATRVPPPPGGPITVTTVRAERRSLPVIVDGTGTVVPVSSVDVKPQVASVVKSVHVKEGQFVKAGDLLFTLDARADEANVEKLRAQMARDETALADLKRVLDRNRELREKNFVSQAVVESAQAQVDAQTALVAADRAAVEAARVPLSYARIVAPSAGRVGVVGAWPGAAVIANQTTLLTVTRIDPIDVSFAVPQRWLQDVLSALGSKDGATVVANLPDGRTKLEGRLVFVDNAIDAASGTVRVKARFSNSPSVLWPGAFVKTSLEIGSIDDASVVPQASVIRGPRGTFVFVVVDGKAVPRPVEVVGSRGDDAAVRGVKPGEPVVLDGRQNLRPGWPVREQGSGGAGGGGGSGGAGGGGPGGAAVRGPGAGPGLVQADTADRRSAQ